MMILQMFQMGLYSVCPFFYHLTDHSNFVIGLCLTSLYSDSPFRTVPDTGSQTVTHKLRHKPYLAVNHLERPFMAVWHTESATVALLLIYLNNIPFHLQVHSYMCKDRSVRGADLYQLLQFAIIFYF